MGTRRSTGDAPPAPDPLGGPRRVRHRRSRRQLLARVGLALGLTVALFDASPAQTPQDDPGALVRAAFALSAENERRGDVPAAIAVLSDAHARLPEGHVLRPLTCFPWAHLIQRSGDFDGALNLLDAALEECARFETEDPPAFAATREQITIALLGLRGFVEVRRGRADLGRAAIADALAYEEDRLAAADPARPCDAGFLMSAVHAEVELLTSSDQFERAVAKIEALLVRDELFARADLGAHRARLEITLATALIELGQDEGRSVELLEAASERDDLGANDRLQARLRLAHLALRSGDAPDARAQLDVARTLAEVWATPIDRAFLAALASRARAQGDTRLDGELHDTSEQVLANWYRLERPEGGLAPLRHVRERFVFGERLRRALHAHGPELAFAQLARFQGSGTLARRLDAPRLAGTPAEARELQRALVPPGGGLAAWYVGSERAWLFLVDERRVHALELEVDADLAATGRAYAREKARPPRRSGADPRSSRLAALEARLAPVVLPAPLVARLGEWSALTIVGDELLGAPGFESLRLPGAPPNEPLGATHALTYQPSLSAGLALARRRAARGPSVRRGMTLVARVASAAAGTAELTADKLAALSNGFADARVHAGPDAGAEVLVSAALEGTALLEIFAHGEHDARRGMPSGFTLSNPEGGEVTWFGTDVLSIVAPPLVALAICSAGRGPERAGDAGSSDLTGAFLRAGADAVIAGTADLELHATRRLFTHLNAALAAGQSPARALQSARAAAIAEGLDDPFEFALVRVVGLGDAPLAAAPDPAPSRAPLYYAAAATFAGLVWITSRSRARSSSRSGASAR